jgi:hypothetical protein
VLYECVREPKRASLYVTPSFYLSILGPLVARETSERASPTCPACLHLIIRILNPSFYLSILGPLVARETSERAWPTCPACLHLIRILRPCSLHFSLSLSLSSSSTSKQNGRYVLSSTKSSSRIWLTFSSSLFAARSSSSCRCSYRKGNRPGGQGCQGGGGEGRKRGLRSRSEGWHS